MMIRRIAEIMLAVVFLRFACFAFGWSFATSLVSKPRSQGREEAAVACLYVLRMLVE